MTEGTDGTTESSTSDEPDVEREAVEAVGTYETDEGIVFYDTENPLAWLQSAQTVRPEEMV